MKKIMILFKYLYRIFILLNTLYTKYNNVIRAIYMIVLLLIFIYFNIEVYYAQDVPAQDTADQPKYIVNYTSEDLIKKVRDQAIERYEDLKERHDNCTNDEEKEVLAAHMEQAYLHVELLEEECAKYDKVASTSNDSSSQEQNSSNQN